MLFGGTVPRWARLFVVSRTNVPVVSILSRGGTRIFAIIIVYQFPGEWCGLARPFIRSLSMRPIALEQGAIVLDQYDPNPIKVNMPIKLLICSYYME